VPTYQYACTACEEHLEVIQRFSDDPLTVCPECGGRLRKQFSPVGIVFKGSGFYRNDSRGSSSASNGSKDTGSKDSGSKDRVNGSAPDSTKDSKSSGTDAKPGSSASDSSSSSSGGDAKPAKKADSAGSAKSSGTGAKVA
jgi:putative FmdB family regulatory protein